MAALPMGGASGHEFKPIETALLRRMKYATSQEGPFFKVTPRKIQESGRINDEAGTEVWPSSPSDVRRIVSDRGHPAYGTPQYDPITRKTAPLMPKAEVNVPLQATNKYDASIGLPPISQSESARSNRRLLRI